MTEKFLGVGTNFRLLMQSCRFLAFFSPDLSNFPKTVHTIFIKFCSPSTAKGAPACAKTSNSYSWVVRNLAKISPKMAKVIFRLFLIFSKTVDTIRTKYFSHSTPYYGPLCAISLNSCGWDVRSIAKIYSKMAKNSRFSTFLIFAKTVQTIRTKFCTVPLYYGPLCVISSNSYCWDVRNIAKIDPKMAKYSDFSTFFRFLQKLSKRFERKFLQSFSTP